MVVNFRGNRDFRYVVGDRFEIPFFMVSSEEFQKTEEELLAYEMPLTEVIERNSVLDIQRIEDENFIDTIDAAITSEGTNTTVSGVYADGASETGSIPKDKIKSLFDLLDGNELRADTLLMDSTMFNRLFLYDATTVGDAVGSEMHVNGYSYAILFCRKLVVSNKKKKQDGTDLLNNKIYAFTSQDFLGQFLVLNDTKFFIEKRKNIITFAAYETIGVGIGNTKSCAVLNLW